MKFLCWIDGTLLGIRVTREVPQSWTYQTTVGSDPSLRKPFIKSSLAHRVLLEPIFESYVKLLGSPFAIS